MPICSFCGKSYEWPRGLTVASSVDGRMSYLCSSKCRKNMNLKRDKKKVKWIIKNKEKTQVANQIANQPK